MTPNARWYLAPEVLDILTLIRGAKLRVTACTDDTGRIREEWQRFADALSAFAKIGVDKSRIEAKLGTTSKFTAVDLANLQISYQSIRRNEISADDEFPRIEGAATGKSKLDMLEEAIEPSTEGRADTDMGETTTLDSAKAEIDRCEFERDVNARVTALAELLGDDDAAELRGYALDRIAGVEGWEVMRELPSPATLQAQVDTFNARYPVGQRVSVRKDGGDGIVTTTRTAAQVLSGHSAVIWLDGIGGCYLLDRVTPLVEEAA